MNYDLLNEAIDYIEENLTEEISYKKLARIVGVSEYTLQRIFMFLTNYSLSEYIRRRRLSKAFEELKTTDIKVIDVAIKYGYDSSISFARAFKKYFNMSPTECRKSNNSYKLFPIYKFKNEDNNDDEYHYEIKDIDDIKIYCYKVCDKNHDDLLYKIRKLYQKIRKNGIRKKLDEAGMYGISIYENELFEYYVGSSLELKDTEKIIIKKGKYVVFEVGSEEQNDIVKVYDFVYDRWLKSTNYEIDDEPEIEFYEKNNCFIYFKLKDKQN